MRQPKDNLDFWGIVIFTVLLIAFYAGLLVWQYHDMSEIDETRALELQKMKNNTPEIYQYIEDEVNNDEIITNGEYSRIKYEYRKLMRRIDARRKARRLDRAIESDIFLE